MKTPLTSEHLLRSVFSIQILLVVLIVSPVIVSAGIAPADLRCEYLTNPLGIDRMHPQFSWELSGSERGLRQGSYQILVASRKDRLTEQRADLWNSGKVDSDASVYISYPGKALQSNSTYYWKVRVWDGEDNASEWSDVATFHTGMLQRKDWAARWITPHDPDISSPLLRKEFILGKPVEKAYAFISGLGYYELYLNGEKVGDHVLDPGWTEYDKRVLYATYEVSGHLQKGNNAVGIMLGNAYYTMTGSESGQDRYMAALRNPGPPKKGIMLLVVEYSDGSKQQISTDESWKSHSGPITYNHFYGGEDYDARLEQEGWKHTDFDDSSWQQVNVIKEWVPMDSQLLPAIELIQTIDPISRTNPSAGVHLFDLGQNILGWVRFRVQGDRGTVVTIRTAETLNNQQFPKPLESGDSLSTKHSYHAKVYARYTLKGDEAEVYESHFFYKGFRYVEIAIDNPDGIDTLDVTGRVVHSGLERNGTFASSDNLLNTIHELTYWAIAGNTHSVPTDCPQREKLGYTGDGQVIAEASIHMFDMTQFYEKWLNDIKDAQHPGTGYVPRTAPEVRAGGGPGWGSACIFIPWDFYTYYGNERILAEYYDVMKRWVNFLESRAKGNILYPYPVNDNIYDFLGDWVPPGRGIGQQDRWTGTEMRMLTNTFVYHRNVRLLAQVARILGEDADAVRYEQLADNIQTAFNDRFLHTETNQYGDGRQPFNVFAMAENLVPENREPAVVGNIVSDIEERNGHLDTGISGTKFLFDVLTEGGYADIAHEAATQMTYPGYGYWIKNGATTLWEQWNGAYSHNHQMFGSVVAWFYKYLAGIRPLEPGYKQISIKPYPPQDLKQVSAALNTMHGEVSAAWIKAAAYFRLWTSLPANTGGVVSIPMKDPGQGVITESGNVIWDGGQYFRRSSGIMGAKPEEGYVEFTVGSGTYSFAAAYPKTNE